MLRLLRILGLCGPLLGAACSTIRDDIGEPDGAMGPYMNRFLSAETHVQRSDRYLLGLVVLAPLALETSEPGEDIQVAIKYVNRSYVALQGLYGARGLPESDASVSKHAFETHSYDVQKAYYRLIKTVALNLDIDDAAKDLMALDLDGLVDLARRADEVLPPMRRASASYRDAVLIYAHAVGRCEGAGKQTEFCAQLVHQKGRVAGQGSPKAQARYIDRTLAEAKRLAASSDGANWGLSAKERLAALYHLKKACLTAEPLQAGATGEEKCASGQSYTGLLQQLRSGAGEGGN